MSAKLRHVFISANRPPPTMWLPAVIGDATSAAEWLRAVAELAILLALTMELQGVATAAVIRGDTLAGRVIREVEVGGEIFIGRAKMGAWVRVLP